MRLLKRIIGRIIVFVVCAAIAFGTVDLLRVKSFERPLFCICNETVDDGGSGHYRGLGYSFEIKGNFMPEDELPGVTEYDMYILGIHAAAGIRD